MGDEAVNSASQGRESISLIASSKRPRSPSWTPPAGSGGEPAYYGSAQRCILYDEKNEITNTTSDVVYYHSGL